MSEQDPSQHPRNPLDVGRYRALAWTDEHVRRFWEYESQFPENYFSYGYRDRLVPRLRGMLTGKKRVLDFGCGGGFLIPALSRVAGEVYGVDFSPTSIELTRERSASISNFRGAYSPIEALDMGLKFDGILAVEVIEHLSDEQLAGTMDIIKRMLEPGGVIVFTTPNDEDLSASRLYCPNCDHVFHRWQHVRSWDVKTLRAFLEDHGFRDVKTWTTDFSPPVGLGIWGQVRRAARAIGNGVDLGLPHLVGAGALP
ncbi:MAG: class I SAM-dependent methyltransferase [Myxococcales bacterium]|nr:class I SAM-dependent methyltransferase [Myxococcales bacterium]